MWLKSSHTGTGRKRIIWLYWWTQNETAKCTRFPLKNKYNDHSRGITVSFWVLLAALSKQKYFPSRAPRLYLTQRGNSISQNMAGEIYKLIKPGEKVTGRVKRISLVFAAAASTYYFPFLKNVRFNSELFCFQFVWLETSWLSKMKYLKYH